MTTEMLLTNTRDAVKNIRLCKEHGVLVAARQQEQDAEAPRSTILNALDLQIAQVEEQIAEMKADDEVVAVAPAAKRETVAEKAERIATEADRDSDAKAESKSSTVEPTDVDTCARAFVNAMRGGNLALVTEMIRQVRTETANDAALADALIRASKTTNERTTARPKSSGKRTSGPGASTVARIEAAIAAGTNVDGAITLTVAQMVACDFPPSWMKWNALWSPNASAGTAAASKGFRGKLSANDSADAVLTLSPI